MDGWRKGVCGAKHVHVAPMLANVLHLQKTLQFKHMFSVYWKKLLVIFKLLLGRKKNSLVRKKFAQFCLNDTFLKKPCNRPNNISFLEPSLFLCIVISSHRQIDLSLGDLYHPWQKLSQNTVQRFPWARFLLKNAS